MADRGHPVHHHFTVRGRLDDDVHLLNAPLDAVVFPSAYTTWCGQSVAEICRDGRPATCAACARSAGAQAAPNASNAELRTGEHAR
jgi:hypothetical protein